MFTSTNPSPQPRPVWRGEGVVFVRYGYQDAPRLPGGAPKLLTATGRNFIGKV